MSEPFRPYEKLVEITISGQEIPGAGAQFAAALLPVHQPGDHSVRPILLESGVPILPRNLPIAGRRRAARNVELQVHRHGGHGNHRVEPGAEVVFAGKIACRFAGFFVTHRFILALPRNVNFAAIPRSLRPFGESATLLAAAGLRLHVRVQSRGGDGLTLETHHHPRRTTATAQF